MARIKSDKWSTPKNHPLKAFTKDGRVIERDPTALYGRSPAEPLIWDKLEFSDFDMDKFVRALEWKIVEDRAEKSLQEFEAAPVEEPPVEIGWYERVKASINSDLNSDVDTD